MIERAGMCHIEFNPNNGNEENNCKNMDDASSVEMDMRWFYITHGRP